MTHRKPADSDDDIDPDDELFDDDDLDFETATSQLQSQAERELFEALQNNKDRIRKMSGTTQ